ncbi:MAG: EAL domain-containing protein [Actinomycetota bacterium]|nr:EAL domain-containing protein [Actinomycetota bacterium]
MAILDALAAHAAILDSNGLVVATNDAWSAFAKEHPSDPWRPEVGQNYLEACEKAARSGSGEATAVADAVRSVLAGTQVRFHVDYPSSSGGDDLWFSLRVSALAVEGGGAVVTHNDITGRKRAEMKLAHQALHDPLTGLPNRTLFLDRLSLGLARMERSQTAVAVLFLDLDKFKAVNDTLGHDVGDQLLVDVANRLRAALRPGDTAARYGGDEFTVLCEGITSENDAVVIAERVSAAIGRPFAVDDADTVLTSSIGIAITSGEDASPERLIHDADTAMYRAKQRGRARYELFSGAIRQRAIERLEVENALHRALEGGEFRLRYQPEIDLANNRMTSVEALVRWEHPHSGLLPPADWLPLAEELGLIVPIGAWVVGQACRQAAAWHHYPDRRDLRVTVNLSQRELVQPGVVDTFLEAASASGVQPSSLGVEVRQTALADGGEIVAATLSRFRAEGVSVAVDDFGTASAWLAHPVDTVKLDLSTIDDDPEGRVVSALIALGHALGMRVVGKKVETADQLDRLATAGCEGAQGFYLAQPQAAQELQEPRTG